MSDSQDRSNSASNVARLELPDGVVELPVVYGSEGEKAVDIRKLRPSTGWITLDDGYRCTGSCESSITFIDGEKGILRYRGYPIEQVAEHSTFTETAMLIINGERPTPNELAAFSGQLTCHARLHEGLRHHFEGFPPNAPPMAILSAMINATSCYHLDMLELDEHRQFLDAAAQLLSKVRTIAAFSYKVSQGQPIVYPDPHRNYVDNFLHMMFSEPHFNFRPSPEAQRALDIFLILHADHEQNCSTSTTRMVGSSRANLFASVSAAVCALWGRLHGGANAAVIRMLEEIHSGGSSVASVVEKVKKKETLLWGFGHRVYKNFDPRTAVLKKACDAFLESLGTTDPLLDIARELEEVAVHDPYFLERKLYPNVDFYSGILLRALNIPLDMFPVMFAIGRLPGWIANWREVERGGDSIYRPRQIYTGENARVFKPSEQSDKQPSAPPCSPPYQADET